MLASEKFRSATRRIASTRSSSSAAVAEFPFIHGLQRQLYPGQVGAHMRLAGLGHLLLLHGIHARQSPDHLLVQLHRLALTADTLKSALQFPL